jgi:Icc-related predicted phosphoesterase
MGLQLTSPTAGSSYAEIHESEDGPMTGQRHLRRLVAAGAINGSVDALKALLAEAAESDADALVIVGDLAANGKESLRAIFSTLGEGQLPTFWVPGAADAPVSAYLRESYNMEIVHPHLHGVHGTFAIGPGRVLFAGMGGELVDEPEATRLEDELLRYPAWELEYRLKTIGEFSDYEKVFLFATQPAHKGLHRAGSEAVAVLINTYRPRLAIVPGDEVAETRLGTTLVVSPGRLDQGEYALIDLHDLSVQPRMLVDQASV